MTHPLPRALIWFAALPSGPACSQPLEFKLLLRAGSRGLGCWTSQFTWPHLHLLLFLPTASRSSCSTKKVAKEMQNGFSIKVTGPRQTTLGLFQTIEAVLWDYSDSPQSGMMVPSSKICVLGLEWQLLGVEETFWEWNSTLAPHSIPTMHLQLLGTIMPILGVVIPVPEHRVVYMDPLCNIFSVLHCISNGNPCKSTGIFGSY